jgi:hypothetical protein
LQDLALPTAILIGRRFIAEVGGRPDLIALFPIRQREIGSDALIFQSLYIVDSSIFGVASHEGPSKDASANGYGR